MQNKTAAFRADIRQTKKRLTSILDDIINYIKYYIVALRPQTINRSLRIRRHYTLGQSNVTSKILIQKKIDQADIQNTALVIPTAANILPNNDLREGIICKRKRLQLLFRFCFVR